MSCCCEDRAFGQDNECVVVGAPPEQRRARVQEVEVDDVHDVNDVHVGHMSFQFQAWLKNRHGKPWGLTLDSWLEGLQVVGIDPGSPVDEYNSHMTPDRKIVRNDFIVAANGFRDWERILQELQKGRCMSWTVVRPSFRAIRIQKRFKEDSLGFNVVYNAGVSTSMRINLIAENSAAERHNMGCDHEARLLASDFITRVNAVSDSADEMLEELQASMVVDLSVLRLPPREMQSSSPRDAIEVSHTLDRQLRAANVKGAAPKSTLCCSEGGG